MNQTTTALLLKLGATFMATWISLGLIEGNTLGPILLVAIIGTILNYVMGDLMVLPRLGNIVACIGDGLMAAFIAYIVSLFFPAFRVSSTGLLIFAAIVGVTEYFFHIYLYRKDKVSPKS